MTHFLTATDLARRIDAYFDHIEGEYHLENKTGKVSAEDAAPAKKIWDREPEPATLTGLALWLKFSCRDEFFDYEESGSFAATLKAGRMRVETVYEKKLHHQSPSGAIFVLKSMGWNERTETKVNSADAGKNLTMVVLETGPKPAETENEVVLH